MADVSLKEMLNLCPELDKVKVVFSDGGIVSGPAGTIMGVLDNMFLSETVTNIAVLEDTLEIWIG